MVAVEVRQAGHSRLQLRSGREHCPQRVVVEVWQGTLGTAGRSSQLMDAFVVGKIIINQINQTIGGPAGNTGRRGSRVRSGREHWPRMLAVEV